MSTLLAVEPWLSTRMSLIGDDVSAADIISLTAWLLAQNVIDWR